MTATVRGLSERDLVARAIQAGRRDANELTNLVFYARHPAMTGRRISPRERGLVREWLTIRDRMIRPAIAAATGSTVSAPGAPGRLRSTQWLRSAWSDYACAEGRMVPLRISGPAPR
jgi:hypothetical protein